MNLFQLHNIDQAIINSIESAIDPETGEIINMGMVADLVNERQELMLDVVCYIKSVKSSIDALREEERRLKERRERMEKQQDTLEFFLSTKIGGQKMEDSRCQLSWRKSEYVDITDERSLPSGLVNVKEICTPDKTRIKDLLKQGQDIPGATLKSKLNIQIK